VISGSSGVRPSCYVDVQVMTEQFYVLAVHPRKRRLIFIKGQWDTNSDNLCTVSSPHLRGMCDPMAVPASKVEGIANR
jgi:hypothetical protein